LVQPFRTNLSTHDWRVSSALPWPLKIMVFANIDSLEHHAVYVSDSMRPQQVLWTP
jgi:hypothetical protein